MHGVPPPQVAVSGSLAPRGECKDLQTRSAPAPGKLNLNSRDQQGRTGTIALQLGGSDWDHDDDSDPDDPEIAPPAAQAAAEEGETGDMRTELQRCSVQ